jgi:phosphonate transport system substrate-binding protein
LLRALACAPLAWGVGASWAKDLPPVSIGLTPVFLDDQIAFLQRWQAYLQQHLQRPVRFFQRGSYSEVLRLLQDGRVDFAWLCGYPYWRNRDWLKLAAVPVYQGQPLYQSYLIRHQSHPEVASLADLRGKVFAYSDPDSNSGFLYPQHRLRMMQADSRSFFGRTFFTWSHRKVVEAVAVQLAHAGSVDGYVWDVLAQLHPQLTGETEIFERSPKFGFPPVVAAQTVDEGLFRQFQSLLTDMSKQPEGKKLLKTLALDGFTPAEPELFASMGAMIPER